MAFPVFLKRKFALYFSIGIEYWIFFEHFLRILIWIFCFNCKQFNYFFLAKLACTCQGKTLTVHISCRLIESHCFTLSTLCIYRYPRISGLKLACITPPCHISKVCVCVSCVKYVCSHLNSSFICGHRFISWNQSIWNMYWQSKG